MQLEDYWVDELSIKDGVGEGTPAVGVLPKIEFDVFRAPDELKEETEQCLVSVTVSASKAKVRKGIPYEFRLRLSGVFSFLPDTDDDAKERLLFNNAPAMLYGIARGIIGEVTATGRQGRYILPSINFVELLERQERRWARSQAQN